MRLILASASPRRAELLRGAGYDFEIVACQVDESMRAGEPPSTYVRRLAAEKSAAAVDLWRRPGPESNRAARASDDVQHVVFLGADTTVVVDDEILGKPHDDDDGRRMLARLSGKTHQVLTGVSLRLGAYEVGRVETTSVVFRALTDGDIAWYSKSGEWRDKAGGYAIQGLASRFIPSIAGSYSNVVGLPIACVDELLRSLLASRP